MNSIYYYYYYYYYYYQFCIILSFFNAKRLRLSILKQFKLNNKDRENIKKVITIKGSV